MTTYDMIKIFNDEASLVMAERAGLSAGARSVVVKASIRGREMIRNFGRVAGVKFAGMTGGPALVMAGTGARLADNLLAQGNMSNVYAIVADAVADPALAKILLVDEATLTKAGRFNFGKKAVKAIKPYLFFAGPSSQVVRVGVEDQNERDRIKREGGETELYYDEETDRYVRRPINPPAAPPPAASPPAAPPPAASPPAAPYLGGKQRMRQTIRGISPASTLFDVSAFDGGQAPNPPKTAAMNQGTQARGQSAFGPNDPIFASHGGSIESGKDCGIMSVPRKPRQLVG